MGLLGGQGFIGAKASLDPYAVLCGTELRFGSLYNLGLPKEQRFFWKGTKAKSCKLNNHLTDKVCTDFIFNPGEGYS